MKNRTLNGRDPVSIIAILQDFGAACNAWNKYKGVAMGLFKHYLNGSV